MFRFSCAHIQAAPVEWSDCECRRQEVLGCHRGRPGARPDLIKISLNWKLEREKRYKIQMINIHVWVSQRDRLDLLKISLGWKLEKLTKIVNNEKWQKKRQMTNNYKWIITTNDQQQQKTNNDRWQTKTNDKQRQIMTNNKQQQQQETNNEQWKTTTKYKKKTIF